MSAEVLREAAALMRELADKADAQPVVKTKVEGVWLGSRFYMVTTPERERALADWLDSEDTHQFGPTEHAINVARAYLGSDS